MSSPELQVLQITLSSSANIHRQGKYYSLVSGSGDTANNNRDFDGPLFQLLNYITFLEKKKNQDTENRIGPNWSTQALFSYFSAPPVGALCFRVGSGEHAYTARMLISIIDFYIDPNFAFYKFAIDIGDPIFKMIEELPDKTSCRIGDGQLTLSDTASKTGLIAAFGIREILPVYKPTSKPKYLFVKLDSNSTIGKVNKHSFQIKSSLHDSATNSIDYQGPLGLLLSSYPSEKPVEWTQSNFNRLFKELPYLTLFLDQTEQHSFKVESMEVNGSEIKYRLKYLGSSPSNTSLSKFGVGSSVSGQNSLILMSPNQKQLQSTTASAISYEAVFNNRISNYTY